MALRSLSTVSTPFLRAISCIDTPALLRTLNRWIEIPSISGHLGPSSQSLPEIESPSHEVKMQLQVLTDLKNLGFDPISWPYQPSGLAYKYKDPISLPTEERLGVFASYGSGDAPHLLLTSHTDVVTVLPEVWQQEPWKLTRSGDKFYGRGVADTKGNGVAAIHAIHAIRKAKIRLKGTVHYAAVSGEESTCEGTLALTDKEIVPPDAGVIVLEPTGLRTGIEGAGVSTFRLTLKGRAAHASVRHVGKDPYDDYYYFRRSVQALEYQRNRRWSTPSFLHWPIPFPITLGGVRGGFGVDVPDEVSFLGRVGYHPEENPLDVRQEFEDMVTHFSEMNQGIELELSWIGPSYEPFSQSEDLSLVKAIRSAHLDLGRDFPLEIGVPYGCDLGHFPNHLGVVFGMGEIENAHVPDEFVHAREPELATQILCATILRYCGVREEKN